MLTINGIAIIASTLANMPNFNKSKYHLDTGKCAEELAYSFLSNNGLVLVSKNFYSRFGEIDLIMQDQGSLVFVEVRYRWGSIELAAESITYAKQRKLIRTANYYLLCHNLDVVCRFDAILVDKAMQCHWLKNIITL